jgi:hypothetical protein
MFATHTDGESSSSATGDPTFTININFTEPDGRLDVGDDSVNGFFSGSNLGVTVVDCKTVDPVP